MIPGIVAGAPITGGPIDPGQPPTILSGLTFWYDADNSAIYKGGSTDAGFATADNDLAARVDSNDSISRCMAGGNNDAKLKLGVFGSNRAVQFTNDTQNGFAQPIGNANPIANTLTSTLLTVGNKVIMFAGKVASGGTPGGVVYGNTPILSDAAGYVGLHLENSGTDVLWKAYNYAGGEQIASATTPKDTPVIVTMKHSGGVLRIRVNGVEIDDISSGNTDTLGSNAGMGRNDCDYSISQVVICNASNSDADLLEVEKYCAARMGLSI